MSDMGQVILTGAQLQSQYDFDLAEHVQAWEAIWFTSWHMIDTLRQSIPFREKNDLRVDQHKRALVNTLCFASFAHFYLAGWETQEPGIFGRSGVLDTAYRESVRSHDKEEARKVVDNFGMTFSDEVSSDIF